MKQCKKCGIICQDSQNFCGECGSNLESRFTYICNHCGRIYNADSVECPKCHAKPDIQLPATSAKKAKELQETATQKADELKEKAAAAATVASGAAVAFLKTASNKASEAKEKATELAKNASEKTIETKEKVVNTVQVTSTSVSGKESLPTNNKLVIPLLVVAALVIGVFGGYILFGQSSDDKNTVAQRQPVRTQQTTKSTAPIPNPKPVEKPKPIYTPTQQFRVDQRSPRNAFLSFHGAITNRQLAEAYNILSPQYQKFMRSYDNFARGYVTTLRSDIVGLNTVSEGPNSATYTYKLKAVDRQGSGTLTQYFVGKATLVRINGLWRLDSTEAKRL